jgi:hypothetical protein
MIGYININLNKYNHDNKIIVNKKINEQLQIIELYLRH